MPIYEYRCADCGHELEVMQRIADPSLTDCPACSRPSLKRLISAVGFRLKGGGWYETDFKSKNKRNLHETGAESKSGEKPAAEPSKAKSEAPAKNSAKPPASGGASATAA
jgi:putative FmdB family regulatory protein